MLDVVLPLSLVDSAISPDHDTMTRPQIINELAFVAVSGLPGEDPATMLHVLKVLSLVLVAQFTCLLYPHASALLLAPVILSSVLASIGPGEATIPMEQAFFVLANMLVTIGEEGLAHTLLLELLPLPLVSVALLAREDPESISSRVLPLSLVSLAISTDPCANAMPHSLVPIALVDLFVAPHVAPLAMRLSILILPIVYMPVSVPLSARALSLVPPPLPLVASVILVYHDSATLSLALLDLTHVYRVVVLKRCETWTCPQLGQVETDCWLFLHEQE